MRGVERASGPGISRLLALCAVLLGLFLMHGSPTAAAGGCHSGMGMAQTGGMDVAPGGGVNMAPAAPSPHDIHASAMAWTGAEAQAVQGRGAEAPQVKAMDDGDPHGALCVAAPVQKQHPLPLAPLVCVLAIAVLAAWAVHRARSAGGTRRRGPPGGRDLLLQVCIART